jgi:hypothetical protein
VHNRQHDSWALLYAAPGVTRFERQDDESGKPVERTRVRITEAGWRAPANYTKKFAKFGVRYRADKFDRGGFDSLRGTGLRLPPGPHPTPLEPPAAGALSF